MSCETLQMADDLMKAAGGNPRACVTEEKSRDPSRRKSLERRANIHSTGVMASRAQLVRQYASDQQASVSE